jgi:hypothetical protein
MQTFSVARAFSAGVELIERKPWTLVWWTLAVIVLELAPRLAVSAYTGGDELGAMRELVGSIGNLERYKAAVQHLREAQASLGLWAWALSLWSVLCSAIFYNAAYRSVLEPQKSAFGYLRLGAAEFWQFLTLIVVWVMVVVYAVVCALLVGVVAFAAKAVGPPATGWIMGVTILAVVGLSLWLGLRLSLGTVATFAQRRFAFFESWKLTKGLVWRMFWTAFLSVALLIGIMLLFLYGALLTVLPLAGAFGRAHTAPPPPALHAHAVAEILSFASLGVLVWLVVGALIAALVRALTATPWAAIYRSVTGGEGPAH